MKFKEYNRPVIDMQKTVLSTGDPVALADNGYICLGYIERIEEDGQVYVEIVRSGSGTGRYWKYAWPSRQIVVVDWE